MSFIDAPERAIRMKRELDELAKSLSADELSSVRAFRSWLDTTYLGDAARTAAGTRETVAAMIENAFG